MKGWRNLGHPPSLLTTGNGPSGGISMTPGFVDAFFSPILLRKNKRNEGLHWPAYRCLLVAHLCALCLLPFAPLVCYNRTHNNKEEEEMCMIVYIVWLTVNNKEPFLPCFCPFLFFYHIKTWCTKTICNFYIRRTRDSLWTRALPRPIQLFQYNYWIARAVRARAQVFQVDSPLPAAV